MSNSVLSLKNINKTFKQGKESLNVLKNISLDIKQGEVIALVGPSGCGKSTLLQIAGLLDIPDSGGVYIEGKECALTSDKKCTSMRRDKIGFVYQYHHLLAEFSALENVMIAQMIAGVSANKAEKTAKRLLKKLGLSGRVSHRPAQLSGGEQQRVAIARALINDPAILLADEPTGNLDPHTADGVLQVLLEQVRKAKLSMLIVTHNIELAKKADKILKFRDDGMVKSPA